MTTINTREDLESLTGTDEYVQFIDKLKGSLFNVRKDDVLGKWVADESNELIEQYGFTRADFDPIVQPTLPVYTPDNSEALKVIADAKAYLASTDWIVTKITELQIAGDDIAPLKTKYADQLAERKAQRLLY
jgi:hypothetical protein